MTVLHSATRDLPLRLGRPDGAGWVPADRLLEPGSMLLEAYAGLLAAVGFGCLLGAGVTPRLGAGEVSLRFGPGGVPDLVALHEGWEAAARDGDVLDGRVRHRAALGRLAEGLLDGHLGVLVVRLGELRVRRGPRALWGLVANGCANALVEAALAAQHPPERVRALAAAFFGLPGSPLPGPPRLLEVPVRDGSKLMRKRLSCCLFCALPGCDPCATCPIFTDEQATERAAARLRALAAGGPGGHSPV